MKELKIRKEKGVTLLSLVALIAVLLILAVTTITLVLDKQGILVKAQESKLESRAATVNDNVEIWKGEVQLNEYSGVGARTEDQMLSDLIDNKLVYENEVNRDDKTITIGKTVISYEIEN